MKGKSAGKKPLRRAASAALKLILAGAVIFVGYSYLKPVMTSGAVTAYESYTAETGDISSFMSFSGVMGVMRSETFTVPEETTVNKLYVQNDQRVKKNDKIALLGNGDILRAGFNGTINEVYAGEGDRLRRGRPIALLCDFENLRVSMSVDEYDIESVRVGQKCFVSVLPLGETFETEISHINRVSSASGAVARYTVNAELAVPQSVLPGMQATIAIPSQSREGVVTLDINALGFDENGNPYVLVERDLGYERAAVVTGLSDGMRVEVLSGVSAGDAVYRAVSADSGEAAFSLTDIYKAIAGETIVINERSPGGGRGGGRTGEATGGGAQERTERSAGGGGNRGE